MVEEALIEITEADGVQLRLAYRQADNFAGRRVYGPAARCLLRPEAAADLRRAVEIASRAGLTVRIFDTYRPQAAQEIFWSVLPDARYVADPAVGSNHTRGVAMDLTLLDANGVPLDMGSGFDDMRERSHHDCATLPAQVQRNRLMLLGVMRHAGLASLATEWWHYELPQAHRFALIPTDPRV
ncbi:MAG TPA: D-alanyl-D-alanine dipeptidase, partial [Nevskiaceae bacterium]|nr:D-alanyl-D-alanine dipeptidase [Nevskiaceae bacterium]